MTNYFLASVKSQKITLEEKISVVTEKYLVNAQSFTEAEARTVNYLKPFVSGDLEVTRITPEKIEDIIDDDGSFWFKARIALVEMNDNGKIRRSKFNYWVKSSDIDKAKSALNEYLKGTIGECIIEKIEETPVMDLIKSE